MDEKLSLQSLDITSEKIEQLKRIIPEVFSEGKINLEKFRQALGEQVETDQERYGISWAGKNESIKNIQTQSTGTLRPNLEESINFDDTENMIIEGDNLEVLKLLQRSYYGKVKMIYIDPPYNTGNEFIYPDNYREGLDEYLKFTGQVDEKGNKQSTNSETSGRYHSKWLTMMYPRLFLARNLLKEDGLIFISIDDNEVHNLRLLMNEIFGEENFISNIIWEKRYGRSNDAKLMSSVSEHLLLYRKSEKLSVLREPRNESNNKDYSNPDNDPRGPWTSVSFVSQRTKDERPNLAYTITNPYTGKEFKHPTNSWKYNKEKYEDMLSDNRFYWGKNRDQDFPRIKRFLSELPEGMVPVNLWKHSETGTTDQGTKEVIELIGKNIFTYPKPISFIQRMLKLGSKGNDIILDFFAGSGTTAQAVMELNKEDRSNRKYICVQLPEKCDEKSEAFKAGYKTIADITKERVRRVINKLQQKEQEGLQFDNELQLDLGFKVFRLDSSNFKVWDGSKVATQPDQIEEQLDLFVENVKDGRTELDILYEIMLKSGFSLTTHVEDIELEGVKVYSVAEKSLFVCLIDKMNKKLIQAMVEQEPEQVICLDMAFHEQDELKTNTVLEMKSRNIKFRTV
ncbi:MULTISPECIES: site-specific DNA-methyltransferase [Bacillaceae]|uniref:site-specific DNA-methyltransferase n=1 Tax=Bacillaceae TaxID=186817 RepID=UPI0004E11449|nr:MULTISPECIES: DNA methyltransferase [Bacillaceae]MCF2647296.1 site-specific DNA-methyltransferase [Niallia circulans]